MNQIPEYHPPKPATPPVPKDYSSDAIDRMIEFEYSTYLEMSKVTAEKDRVSKREEYDAMYQRLCDEFTAKLPMKDDIKIRLLHKHSTPTNRNYIEHVTPTRYQLYAIERFVQELKQKNYNASHGEEVNYRDNPDKDDYYDYCDCYYNVEIKL